MNDNKYYISVCEPWDFNGLGEKNAIFGEVIESLNSKCWIFKTVKPVTIKGVTSEILVLFPRYNNQYFDRFDSGEKVVTINAFLFNKVYSKNLEEQFLVENSIFSIIGDLEKAF